MIPTHNINKLWNMHIKLFTTSHLREGSITSVKGSEIYHGLFIGQSAGVPTNSKCWRCVRFRGSVRHTTHRECVDETQVLTTSQKYLHLSGVLLNQAIRQLQLVGMSGSLPGSMALSVRWWCNQHCQVILFN